MAWGTKTLMHFAVSGAVDQRGGRESRLDAHLVVTGPR